MNSQPVDRAGPEPRNPGLPVGRAWTILALPGAQAKLGARQEEAPGKYLQI